LLEGLLDNPYLARSQTDSIKTLLAIIHNADGQHEQVIALLAPVVEAECRRLHKESFLQLALAYYRSDQDAEALAVLDRAGLQNATEDVPWQLTALELRCKLEGIEACATHTVRLASLPGNDAGFLESLNGVLSQLSGRAAAQPVLSSAVAAGTLDELGKARFIEPPEITHLERVTRQGPKYPWQAERAGVTGFVALELRVGPGGNVLSAEVVDSSPPGWFEEAAVEWALKAEFKPLLVDGEAVESLGRYTVMFKLK
jgi:TonB family protein